MRRLMLALLLVPGCTERSLGTGDGADSSGATSDVTGDDGGTPTSGVVTVTTADPSSPGTSPGPTSDPTMPGTSATVTTSPPDPTTTTGPTTITTTDITVSASDTDGFCPDPQGQPNDSSCTDASGCGCASGKCFVVPILGGFCGECLGDADCAPGGCTVPDPVHSVGSHCNKGEPGAGCESDAVCVDPQHAQCAPVLEVPGIIKVATCGACRTNLDCPPEGHNCTPIYDIVNFGGEFECLPDGAMPDGGSCNLSDDGQGEPIGNQVCASGFCGAADVMGLLEIGVCGACNSDADCPGNTPTCTDPQVDLQAGVLVPAQCQ